MAERQFTRLAHRGVIAVGGEDRRSFLQGLISNDIAKAGEERALWSAFLTPQGKFVHDMFVVEADGRLLLDVEAERAEEFRKKLSLYKLRAKVTLAVEPLSVWAAFGDDAAAALGLLGEKGEAKPFAGGVAFVDPRLAEAGLRLALPSETGEEALAAAGFTPADFAAWDERRIRLGLPDGSRDLPVDKAILLENGFDELDGVSFTKGCYMGQELTSRTKHRGLVRKRLMPVAIDGPAPQPGTPVMVGEAEAGEMRSAVDKVGLALIRLEHFRKADAVFTCEGTTLKPWQPDWAVFPEAE